MNTQKKDSLLSAASFAATAAATTTYDDPKEYLDAPYSYQNSQSESVALNGGALLHSVTDFVLPGRNGFDLAMVRQYDSSTANMQDMSLTYDAAEPLYSIYSKGISVRFASDNSYHSYLHTHFATGLTSEEADKQLALFTIKLTKDYYFENFTCYTITGDHDEVKEQLPKRDVIISSLTGELIKKEQLHTANSAKNRTHSVNNRHLRKTYGLGYGWGFKLPSIEFVPADKYKNAKRFLHLADGRSFEIYDKHIKQYKLYDVQYHGIGGWLSAPYGGGVSYNCYVTYKNGNADYFTIKNAGDDILEAYSLVAQSDRFGNVIQYHMTDYGGMEIIDSWNESTKLTKSGGVLTWELPDGKRITYHTDGEKLSQVDQSVSESSAPQVTKYEYTKSAAQSARFFSAEVDTPIDIYYMNLTAIVHPTKARTEYTYDSVPRSVNDYAGNRYLCVLSSRKDIDPSTGMVSHQVQYKYENHIINKYFQTVQVTRQDGITESHNFKEYKFPANSKNLYYLLSWKTVSHSTGNISTIAYAYGTDDHNFNLPTKETVYSYQPGSNVHTSKITDFIYTVDKGMAKANVETMTETYTYTGGTEPDKTQITTFAYDTYANIITDKTYYKEDGIQIAEKYLLQDGKAVRAKKVYEAGQLKERTEYTYDGTFHLLAEHRYHGDNLESSTACNSIYYGYDDGLFVPNPTRREIRGVMDADGVNPVTVGESFVYDCYGRITEKTDANGYKTKFAYDGLGRVTLETYLSTGHTKTTAYDDSNNHIVTTDEEKRQKRFEYTSLGKIKQVFMQNPDTLLTSYRYDALERLVEEITYGENRSAKATTSYSYDYLGRVLSKTITGDGVSYAENTTYEDVFDGRYSKSTLTVVGDGAAPSVATVTITDQLGRIQSQTVEGSTVSYTYDKLGNKRTQTDANGSLTQWEYDYAGRVTKETNALKQSIQTTYDALGNKTSVSDRAKAITRFAYDAVGRLTMQTVPFDLSTNPITNAITKYYYDKAGNVTRQDVLRGSGQWRKTAYVYNNRGRMQDTILYEDNGQESRTRTIYNGVGEKREVYTGMVGNSLTGAAKITYTYDRFGNVDSMTDPMNRKETYTYDSTGRLKSKVDRNNTATAYTYDALDRLLTQTVTANGVKTTTTYKYTKSGQKLSEGNEVLTVQSSYNKRGLLALQTLSNGVSKQYLYDANGNRQEFQLYRGNVLEMHTHYSYDTLNRLEYVRRDGQNGAIIARYVYDANGNRSALYYPKAAVETGYTYNAANLVTGLVNKKGTQTRSSYNYTYTPDGNQATKTNLAGIRTDYTYDSMGRLTKESVKDGNTMAYTYDRFSNRAGMTVTGKETSGTVYTYNANNWLEKEVKTTGKAVENIFYRYDANGNQVSREWERLEPLAANKQPGKAGFVTDNFREADATLELRGYNGLGQLSSVYRDGQRTSYRYLPDGLRHDKTVTNRKGEVTATTHLWDGSNIAAEVNAVNGHMKARYFRGIGLITQQIDSGEYYYLHNAHGDVVQQVGPDGNATPEYIYDAFGVQENKNGTDPNPFRYCGEYLDLGSGMYYLRNRYYNPAIGRFTSEDPIRDGLNYYTYCTNNPLRFIDPLGLANQDANSRIAAILYNNEPTSSAGGWGAVYSGLGPHQGVDISAGNGTNVYNIAYGEIVYREDAVPSLNYSILILKSYDPRDPSGETEIYIRYLHMEIREDLKVGDVLSARDRIGWESDKGVPGQYHTHIELSKTFTIGTDGYSRAADNRKGVSLSTPDPTPYFNGWADQVGPWPNHNPPTGGSSYSTYTVKPGDSFWRIAQQQMGNGSKYNDLAKANAMTSSSMIHPGDVLKIPR